MKMQFLFLLCLVFQTNIYANETSKRIEEMESRLDDLELSQALRKFSFSGNFTNQIESFSQTRKRNDLFDSAPSGLQSSLKELRSDQDSYVLPIAMRLELNFDANISKNLNFYSTLGMSKFWNLSGREDRSEGNNQNFKSLRGGYGLKDSGAYFDVAYLRYDFNDSPWTLAIGRMTTNNGPPVNQMDGVGRSGTYPFLSYNVIFDGIAGIYDFKNIVPKDQTLKMRLFYTPFISVDPNDRGSQIVDATGDDNDGLTGESDDNVESHAALITLLTEYSIRDFSWVKRIDLFHSIYTFDKFYDAQRQQPEGAAPSSEYEPYYNSGIDYEGVTSNTIYLGFNGISQSGLNLSFTYNHFDIRSDGRGYDYSDNYLFTANYVFDNATNGGHIIGLEFIANDKNKVPTDSTSFYANDFYNLVNGNGAHLYYTATISPNELMRLGYMTYNEGESEFLFNDIDRKSEVSYIRYKVFF